MVSAGIRRTLVATAAGVLVLTSTGCGAFIARTRIVGASSAVAAARRADAERKSTYEYTAALLYLEKAREAEAYGRFGAAIEFGGESEKLADRAKLNASTAEREAPPAPPEP